MASMLEIQRKIILDNISQTAPGEWKVMVMDGASRRLVDNTVKEDDILNANITNIEAMEERRPLMPDMDAVYLLSPKPHIVDCLVADFQHRRYRKAYLLWTSKLDPQGRERIDRYRNQIAKLQVLNIDYFPRQSHLVTLRDPWSFPILYHPSCNYLIRNHISELAEKIVAICVSLGEYPNIRYYRPRDPLPTHEAHVLCSLLARQVQDELDMWAQYHQDFPPPSQRPRGVLYIVDRSIDLMAPFLHEFTYEAMAFDLLPVKDGDKIMYRTILNEGRPDQEEKDVEITDKDKIWVDNRHKHMKDTIEKLMGDFQKFIANNPHFTKQDSGNATSLNAIKDMMAGLPEFQQMKEAYSLHLSMAQESMNIFQNCKLPDLASIEQLLATGLDEDSKKPKNVADQVVRSLDEEAITSPDRLRLLALYMLFKDGLIPADLSRLRAHASLSPSDEDVLRNLELLGARVVRVLKDKTPLSEPLFPRKTVKPGSYQDEYSLSRYETNIKQMLDGHVANTLDSNVFPYTKPQSIDEDDTASVTAASLRSAKPTWARARGGPALETRQRVIVFAAGGATYSEARACYEVGEKGSKEIYLVSSHMLTPGLWMRQLGDLSADRRRLGLPSDGPKPKTPNWVFEEDKPPIVNNGYPGGPGGPGGPSAMHQAGLGSTAASQAQARRAGSHAMPVSTASKATGGAAGRPPPAPAPVPAHEMAKMSLGGSDGKLQKEKKKHKLFGHSKK